MLSNPIAKPTTAEAIKSEQDVDTTLIPDLGTTYPPATDATATTEKAIKKKAVPPKQKPFLNHAQKQAPQLQDLLSLPGLWESSPAQLSPVQPMFYPMPVYIPYPVPFMLNQPMQVMSGPPKDNVEEKIAMSFNEIMAENLLRSSLQPGDGTEWHKVIRNRIKPANQDGTKKWRGKWRKTTTTTTTTKAPEPTTPPTRILLQGSGNEVISIETIVNNETTEASNLSNNLKN